MLHVKHVLDKQRQLVEIEIGQIELYLTKDKVVYPKAYISELKRLNTSLKEMAKSIDQMEDILRKDSGLIQ